MSHKKPITGSSILRHVAMLVYPDCLMLDAIGPLEVFSIANAVLQLTGRISHTESAYHLSVIAERRGAVKTSSGISIVADKGYEDGSVGIDTLMVAGTMEPAYLNKVIKDLPMRSWLQDTMPKVRRMASICSGALILAEAGLLNGRRATTHWLYSDQLDVQYRRIRVEADKIIVRDGNVYTSAAVTAGIDLALSLVEEDWGWDVASAVARGMLVFMRRPGGQLQFSSYVFAQVKNRKDLRELQAWIIGNPAADLSVESLAERMKMSPRNFSRLFCQEVGITPAKFVKRVRLEAAKNMMLQTDQPIESVAFNCGFNSGEQMRRSFQRALKTTPLDYRAFFKQSSSPHGSS